MRFCLEMLTRRPTYAYHADPADMRPYSLPIGLYVNLDTDLSLPPIWKVHSQQRMEESGGFDKNQDYLILLVRNYKECLIRDLRRMKTVWEALSAPHFLYLENLKLYDIWNVDRKILIYYEDFLLHPRETLERLLLFLNESLDPLDPFFDQFEMHRHNSLTFYQAYIGPSLSQGENLHFHSNSLSPKIRIAMDQQVQSKEPELFYTYLTRYSEPKINILLVEPGSFPYDLE